jgi:hypothetical protein
VKEGVDLQALLRFSTPAAGPRRSLLHDYAKSHYSRARAKQVASGHGRIVTVSTLAAGGLDLHRSERHPICS